MSLWPRRRVQVRRLRAADAGDWRALRLEALANHPEAYGSTHDDWAGRPLADFAARLEGGCVFGACVTGALVGSMALDVEGDSGEVTAVYVQAVHRGQGIARAMLAATLKEARGRRLAQLHLCVAEDNGPALRFYRAAGFRPLAPAPRVLASDGRLLDVVTLARPL
jgi:ribosomal protein S18 acetylase RimI-like enzyme